jgi:hypothetical protein
MDSAHRLGCVAILATVAAPLVLSISSPGQRRLDQPGEIVLSIALICALSSGLLGAIQWLAPRATQQQRREGRGLSILAIVLLALSLTMLSSPRLRSGLATVGQAVRSSMESTGSAYGR